MIKKLVITFLLESSHQDTIIKQTTPHLTLHIVNKWWSTLSPGTISIFV